MIRKLFGERYGQKFAVTALELFPGNLVNHQVVKLLQFADYFKGCFCLFHKGSLSDA